MTTVIFPNGNTYSDDSNPDTGLANGGHRKRFIPLIIDTVIVANDVLNEYNDFIEKKETINLLTDQNVALNQSIVTNGTQYVNELENKRAQSLSQIQDLTNQSVGSLQANLTDSRAAILAEKLVSLNAIKTELMNAISEFNVESSLLRDDQIQKIQQAAVLLQNEKESIIQSLQELTDMNQFIKRQLRKELLKKQLIGM